MLDDGEVVGDEEVGDVALAAEVGQEIEDLALDGDIQGGDGFVADDEIGGEGKGAGDADALALAAGEFVGISVGVGRIEADALQERGDQFAFVLRRVAMPWTCDRLADDVADASCGG